MLTALRVGNFKAFGATQTLPIKPITLIFGANSSGKSSLIHALCLAHEASRTGRLDVFRTELGGDSVDLGGIRQYIYRRDLSKQVEWAADVAVASITGKAAELLAPVKNISMSMTLGVRLDDKGEPILGAEPTVNSYRLDGDGKVLLRASLRADGNFRIDRIERHHPVLTHLFGAMVQFATTSESIKATDFEALDEAAAELLPNLVLKAGKLIPVGLDSPIDATSREQNLLVPISRGQRRQDLTLALRLFLPRSLNDLLAGVREQLERDFERVHYLGPLRSYPPRHLAFVETEDSNWNAGGGFAWDVIRRDQGVRELVNRWLGSEWLQSKYELQVREFVSKAEIKPVLEGRIDDLTWDVAFELAENAVEGRLSDLQAMVDDYKSKLQAGDDETSNAMADLAGILSSPGVDPETLADEWVSAIVGSRSEALSDLVLIDKRTETVVSHRDVGIGISQVLPVLVTAFGSREQLIAIEQPEIHLHPGLQAELADVFIESALGERRNTFILETHSEHLILRVLRRIRETAEGELPMTLRPVHPADVAIVYVQPGAEGAEVIEIKVTETGEFATPWPSGFFAERAKELF